MTAEFGIRRAGGGQAHSAATRSLRLRAAVCIVRSSARRKILRCRAALAGSGSGGVALAFRRFCGAFSSVLRFALLGLDSLAAQIRHLGHGRFSVGRL